MAHCLAGFMNMDYGILCVVSHLGDDCLLVEGLVVHPAGAGLVRHLHYSGIWIVGQRVALGKQITLVFLEERGVRFVDFLCSAKVVLFLSAYLFVDFVHQRVQDRLPLRVVSILQLATSLSSSTLTNHVWLAEVLQFRS